MSGGRVVLAVVCVVWGGGIVLTSLVEGIASPRAWEQKKKFALTTWPTNSAKLRT